MKNTKTLSEQSSKIGFTKAVSVKDIPAVLLEVESECSTLAKELHRIAAGNPQWEQAVSVLAGRTDTMLRQVTDCRRLLTVQTVTTAEHLALDAIQGASK